MQKHPSTLPRKKIRNDLEKSVGEVKLHQEAKVKFNPYNRFWMSYSIIVHTAFERELKYLFKKYPSIKADVAKLGEMLERNPQLRATTFRETKRTTLSSPDIHTLFQEDTNST